MLRLLVPLLVASFLPAAADPLDEALARAGFTRAELGWRPPGWWVRFPRGVTHKLDHFDDLLAEPTAVVPYLKVLGRAVETELAGDGLDRESRGGHGLYRLVHIAGISRRFGGIRPYSPNLTAEPTPLDEAILRLYRYAGRQTKFVTFGQASPYPRLEKDLKAAAAKIPPELGRILGRLVLDIVDAHRWRTRAFRRVPLEKSIAVHGRLDLGRESVDALEYAPACDDVAATWDEASLWYAAGKCVAALDRARRALAATKPGAGLEQLRFDWQTPLGWIRVRGTGRDQVDGTDALLVVDLGGNDEYAGAVAGATPRRPISLCLDLSGDDAYVAKTDALGAGVCGVGILLDAGGRDRYHAHQRTQGAGQFGFGALLDLGAEPDEYVARWSAQGCGYFGVGMLIDEGGSDRYYLHADGQGFGGPGGVGVLCDGAGNDRYIAEPVAAKSGRPSYHSELAISVSNAQGCAMGRRGDGADGHNWAGGFGALLDAAGDDTYTAGNWAHGTGYWFGFGALWDGAGNDRYEGHVWSQATGAHFCIGALIDEGGNDRHESLSHNSLAFGHDFTIALLLNEGGDDLYLTPKEGLGYSINRSVAMLIDTAGDDQYHARNAPGAARWDQRFADRTALSTYWVQAKSIGLFLDLGGRDRYPHGDAVAGAADDTMWGDAPGSKNRRVNNPGVGVDRNSTDEAEARAEAEDGDAPRIDWYQRRQPGDRSGD